MPLSEHEQKILQQLEASLHAQDPAFAEKVKNETVYRHGGRRLKWAIAGFLGGLAVLVVGFTINVLLGFIGVCAMFAAASVGVASVRSMGKASWHDFTRSLREEEPSGVDGIETKIHGAKDWLRDRFGRDGA
jgi:hypothetical protein